MSEKRAELLLATVIVTRSTSFVFNKLGLGTMSAFNLLAVRFLLAFLLLMLLFSVKLGILPSNGFDTPLHWILPLLCSCFGTWAGSSRYIRAMVLDTIRQDYVRTARAKGTPERQVLFRHAFKNALLPLITSIGFSIGNFFGGSIVIEQVFGINGMGRMMLSALREKDIPTVMAGVIITAIMIALGNLVADLLYGVVDPRIRAVYTSGGKKLKKKEAAA